ncbi:MAG: hypothetical protein QOI55_181, partial [Actinomycetota bacterium]|nr:hypothetical protein [Actinomycetota bacterium]
MGITSLLEGDLPRELSLAPLETARYGVGIARLDISPDAAAVPGQILDAFERSEARILVLRYPAQYADWFAQLVRPPLRVLHADTLVYYRQDLERVDPRAALPRGVITGGDALTEREVGSLVRTVFAGYGNHYRANPELDADRSIDGYVEWTVNHVGVDSKALWVLAEHAGGDPIGFA